MPTESPAIMVTPSPPSVPSRICIVVFEIRIGITPEMALPSAVAAAAMPTMTFRSLPVDSMTTLPWVAMIVVPSRILILAVRVSMLTSAVAPTAAVFPPMETAAPTSMSSLEVSVRMLTSLAAFSSTLLLTSTSASELEIRTPIEPAADTLPVGVAEAAASTLMSLSSLTLFTVTLPVLLVTEARSSITVVAEALFITTATVPPAATFDLPPAADRDTRSTSVSTPLSMMTSSFAVTLVPLPILDSAVLSAATTLMAPPIVRLESWLPFAMEADTVTSIISASILAFCAYPPPTALSAVPTVISQFSPMVAFASS